MLRRMGGRRRGMKGQLSLFDLTSEMVVIDQDKESDPEPNINFSCFSASRSEAGGVLYGECAYDHSCSDCEARQLFYEKAEEYQKSGKAWGLSLALAREFFNIPTVPEYTVEAYKYGIEFRDGEWQPKRLTPTPSTDSS